MIRISEIRRLFLYAISENHEQYTYTWNDPMYTENQYIARAQHILINR